VCTLAVLFQAHPAGPLVVAANRDEWLARPAGPLQVLRQAPRTLGGRDLQAGGTWLAVNAHGVVAALTNQPASRDPARRSRGELPLLLTGQPSARAAMEAFLAAGARREAWNPCWLLVGDREALFHLDLTGAGPVEARPLPPGLHVLENRPLLPPTGKALRLAAALGEAARAAAGAEALAAGLGRVLASHEPAEEDAAGRPPELLAPCVHAGPCGTRSATLVLVPPGGAPRVWAAEGPPCTHAFQERTSLWADGAAGAQGISR
jgi:uncharacterized protein with NRDE domain